jgi:hypothetical protein
MLFNTATMLGEYKALFTGLWRIKNAAKYWFRWNTSRPPTLDDPVNGTTATLPHTPADTFTSGTVYVAMTYFNGVLESGFYPVGANNEPYLRIDLDAGGTQTISPPAAPLTVDLQDRGAGTARIVAYYSDRAAEAYRADQWCVAYTTDGTTPPADTPDYTASIGSGVVIPLMLDLDADFDGAAFPASHNTALQVRVQTRRNDGTAGSPDWTYSKTTDADVQSITIDAQGPDAPPGAHPYAGYTPEDR